MIKITYLILSTLIAFCFLPSSAQTIYYHFSQGYFNYTQKNYPKADSCYSIFLKKSTKIDGRQYANIAKNFLESGHIDSSLKYFSLAAKNGFNPNQLKKDQYSVLFESVNQTSYLQEISEYYQTYYATLNWKKIEFLIRLTEKDLGIRRVYYAYKTDEILKDTLRKVVLINQESLFEEFKSWITKNNGLPTIEEIGYFNYDKLANTLIHFSSEVEGAYDFIEPIAQKAMKNGDLAPNYYARIVDFYHYLNDGFEIYGSEMFEQTPSGQYTFRKIKDVENVDARRNQIGLNSLKEKSIRWDVLLPDEYKH